jgi:TPR repeat protein
MTRPWVPFVLLLIGVLLSQAARADDIESAIKRAGELMGKSDFVGAVEVLMPYADAKNADVDPLLADAMLLSTATGKKPEEAKAADARAALARAEECAARGNGGCMNVLFSAYSLGTAVQKDWPKALDYLHKAVAAGDAGAKLNYAIILYRGAPQVEKDVDQACRYFREVVNGPGKIVASYYLGVALFRGQCGQAVNREAGVELIQIAANHELPEAERDIAKNYEHGWTVKADLDRAFEWYEKSSAHGDGESSWRIGMAYVNGENRKPDSRRAVEYFERAAHDNYGPGKVSLAVMYVTGDGVPLDYAKARSLYEEAAADGEAHAYRELAIMHANGEGTAVNLVEALVLYEQSVLLEDPPNEALRASLESKMSEEQREEVARRIQQWQAEQAKKP